MRAHQGAYLRRSQSAAVGLKQSVRLWGRGERVLMSQRRCEREACAVRLQSESVS